jgi:NAD(P)-dependent dehydrogenase (short-subunit alcohol dehydrogenase family)
MRALAPEWAADNIRVNAVAPIYVRTDLTVPIFSNPEMMKTVMTHTSLGRLPEPDDIAAAILFLASDAARCITRVVLPMDSGSRPLMTEISHTHRPAPGRGEPPNW